MSVVSTRYLGDHVFESTLGNHTITIDSPESWGGMDRGPMPPQLFMASIGSCVGVLITHFCRQHELDDSGMTIDVCYDKADHPTRFTNIKVVVNMPKTQCADELTQKALKHVAEHCPVHETITTLGSVEFVIETAKS